MSTVLIATLSGLVALFFWGISDWLLAKTSRKASALETNLAVSIPEAILVAIAVLIARPALPSFGVILVIVLIGTLFTATYLLFIKALSSGAIGVVVPLANTNPLITLGLSLLFLSTALAKLQLAAMAIIVIGAVMLAYQKNTTKLTAQEFHKETILALVVSVLWGITFFTVNTVVNKTSWQMLLGIMTIVMILQAFALIIFFSPLKTTVVVKQALNNKIGLMAGVAVGLGSIAFYSGSAAAKSVLILTVITSAAPLVTSLLGAVFDKEKIGVVRRIGAVIVVTGIILLNTV